jgi:hypothetical protein
MRVDQPAEDDPNLSNKIGGLYTLSTLSTVQSRYLFLLIVRRILLLRDRFKLD